MIIQLLQEAMLVLVVLVGVGAAVAEAVDPGEDFQGYMDYKDMQKLEAERIAAMHADHEVRCHEIQRWKLSR